jgi:hypothetical protein
MKFFFSLLLLTQTLFAANLNLKSGESVKIQASMESVVTCNGQKVDDLCAASARGQDDACKNSYLGDSCLRQPGNIPAKCMKKGIAPLTNAPAYSGTVCRCL